MCFRSISMNQVRRKKEGNYFFFSLSSVHLLMVDRGMDSDSFVFFIVICVVVLRYNEFSAGSGVLWGRFPS